MILMLVSCEVDTQGRLDERRVRICSTVVSKLQTLVYGHASVASSPSRPCWGCWPEWTATKPEKLMVRTQKQDHVIPTWLSTLILRGGRRYAANATGAGACAQLDRCVLLQEPFRGARVLQQADRCWRSRQCGSYRQCECSRRLCRGLVVSLETQRCSKVDCGVAGRL